MESSQPSAISRGVDSLNSWRESATLRLIPTLGRGWEANPGQSVADEAEEPDEEENLRVGVPGFWERRKEESDVWDGRVRARCAVDGRGCFRGDILADDEEA